MSAADTIFVLALMIAGTNFTVLAWLLLWLRRDEREAMRRMRRY